LSLRHLILAVLLREPSSGYQVVQEFDLVAGFFWKATHQQVYRELAALGNSGHVEFATVEQTGKPDKKVYSITAAGIDEFNAWFATPTLPPRAHDPLMIKFFAGGERVDELARQLSLSVSDHEKVLAALMKVESEFYPEPADQMPLWKLCIYLSLQLGIERERAWLGWAARSAKMLEVSGSDDQTRKH
jgi:PadR family transcriptional regulator, regulatory protein AphA